MAGQLPTAIQTKRSHAKMMEMRLLTSGSNCQTYKQRGLVGVWSVAMIQCRVMSTSLLGSSFCILHAPLLVLLLYFIIIIRRVLAVYIQFVFSYVIIIILLLLHITAR